MARLMTTWPLCYNDNTTKASAPLIKASQRLQIQFNSLLRWRRWYHYAACRHRGNHCLSWEDGEKKDRHKKEGGEDGVMMMGRPKLTIKTASSDVSKPPVDSCSYTFNTSTAVYLPWLPVIIINMSFSSRRSFVGCWVWPQHYGDRQRGGRRWNWQLSAIEWLIWRAL